MSGKEFESASVCVICGENNDFEYKHIRGVTRDASDVLSYMIEDYVMQPFSSLQNIR